MRIANAPAIDALAARLVGAALAPVAPAAPVRNALDASAGARLILQLLSDSTNAAVRGTRAPLLPANETDTGKVVQALRRALAESGLSYEAHLAEWTRGERTREALQREPQASLPSATSEAPVREEAAAIVRQQLEFLEHRHVTWNGEVWPDLPLEWEMELQAAPVVTTFLRLQLPALGRVEARLTLVGNALELSVSAGDGASETLRGNLSELAAALSNSGFVLGGLRAGTAHRTDEPAA